MTSKETVLEIKRLFESGLGQVKISRQTGVPEQTVRNILRGKRHRKLTGGRLMNGRRDGAKLA